MADGLLQDDARVFSGKPGALKVRGNGLEQVGRGRQVVHPHAAFGLAEVMRQTDVLTPLSGVHGEVVEALAERIPDFSLEVRARDLRSDMSLGQREIGVAINILARNRQDADIIMQTMLAVQVIECRDEFV